MHLVSLLGVICGQAFNLTEQVSSGDDMKTETGKQEGRLDISKLFNVIGRRGNRRS